MITCSALASSFSFIMGYISLEREMKHIRFPILSLALTRSMFFILDFRGSKSASPLYNFIKKHAAYGYPKSFPILKNVPHMQYMYLFLVCLNYSSLFGSAAAASHYTAAGLTPHSPSEAKSGYPYFGQLSSMETGLCGRVH